MKKVIFCFLFIIIFFTAGYSAGSSIVIPNVALGDSTFNRFDTFVAGSVYIEGDTANGSDTLNFFIINNQGTLTTDSVAFVSLYEDTGILGLLELNIDTFVGLLSGAADSWGNYSLNYTFSEHDTGNYFLIVVKTNGGAAAGNTFKLRIPSRGVDTIDDDSSPTNAVTNFDIMTIVGIDVEITAPADSHDTNSQIITVTATTAWTVAGETIELYVNNYSTIHSDTKQLASDSGSWSGTVKLTGPGDSVIAKLTNRYGEVTYDTIQVDYYRTPQILIANPSDGDSSTNSSFVVNGISQYTYIGDTVYITVNGDTRDTYILTSNNGSWSGSVILAGIGDSIMATVTGKMNDPGTSVITASYYAKPLIYVSYPSNGHDTKTQLIVISGTAANSFNGDTVKIWRNNILQCDTYIYGSSNWTGTVLLSGIGDTITVKVTNTSKFGFARYDFDTVYVNYFEVPTLEITYPDTFIHDTSIKIIKISGTTDNSDIGDTLVIYTDSVLNTTVVLTGINGNFEGTVSLANIGDSIGIYLHDKFGRTTFDTITVNYYTPPEIYITYPSDTSADTIVNTVVISGTSTNTFINSKGDTVRLYVNSYLTVHSDTYIGSESAPWTGTASLSGKGDSIIVEVENWLGVKSYDTITVNYYKIPDITILSPANGYETMIVDSVTITGTTLWTTGFTFGYGGDTVRLTSVLGAQSYTSSKYTLLNDNDSWSFQLPEIFGIGNTVTVTVYDNKWGRSDSASIILNYYADPVINLTYPDASNHDTSSNLIVVRGTTLNSASGDSIEIYTNSTFNCTVTLAAANDTFSGTALLTGAGDSVWVRYTDKYGRIKYDTINVSYYAQPQIEVTYPAYSNYDTIYNIITIKGTTANTSNGDSVFLYVNYGDTNSDTMLTADAGSWKGTVLVQTEACSVIVKINDRFGRSGYDTVSISYFDTPTIEITSPSDNSNSLTLSQTVKGTSSNLHTGDTVSIKVRGVLGDTIISSFNSWTGNIELQGIGDSILAAAEDRWGRKGYDTITVNYYGNLKVEITYPDTGINYDTRVSLITISGTCSYAANGDSVQIKKNGALQCDTVIYSDSLWSGTVLLTGIGDTVNVKITSSHLFVRTSEDTVYINYFETPTLEITYPDTVTHDTFIKTIIIKGTTYNSDASDTIMLYSNNAANTTIVLTSINGNFEGTVLLANIKDSIVVEVNDQFGRRNYDTVTVNWFDTPSIEITYPDASHDTYIKVLTVKGSSYASRISDSITVYTGAVADTTVKLTADSESWTGTAYIEDIGESIIVKLVDRFGRKFYDTIQVDFFDTPRIEITYPPDGYDTNITAAINISGTSYFTKGGIDTLYLVSTTGSETWTNNIVLSADNDTWSMGIPEIFGLGNTITITVYDNRWGREDSDVIVTNFFGDPGVMIDTPADGYDTWIKEIIIYGTTLNSYLDDTVLIYTGTNINDTVILSKAGDTFVGTAAITGMGDIVWVRYIDQFGRSKYDTITVNYFDTPSAEITAPQAGYDTREHVITVSGTSLWTSAPDTVVIYSNGQANTTVVITGDNASWSGTAFIDNIGESIYVMLNDRFGRTFYDTITADYFDTPSVEIASPDSDRQDTKESKIIVTGTTWWTAKFDTVVIYTNDTVCTSVILTGDSASWSGSAFLHRVGDTVLVELQDRFGRKAYDTLIINYYETPSINITSPSDGKDTTEQYIEISGTTWWTYFLDTVVIYTNNNTVNTTVVLTGDSANWTGTVFISNLAESVVVELHDTFGRLVYDTISIDYFKAPSIEITSPADSHDTLASIIIVSGTTWWTSDPDTIADTVVIYTDNVVNTTIIITNDSGSWSGTAYIKNISESIVVAVNGRFGNVSYDTITVNYYETPSFEITYPADAHDTKEFVITIKGSSYCSRISDSIIIYTDNTINTSVMLAADSENWTGTAYLNSLGESVCVKLKDRFGREFFDTITVDYFDTPSINITSIADGHDTNIQNITLSGTTWWTSTFDTVVITSNGNADTSVILSGDSASWSGTAYINNIGESVILELTDRFNRRAYDTITVDYYAPPSISITAPADFNDTDINVITLIGTTYWTSNPDTVVIYSNGSANTTVIITQDSGSWSGTAYINSKGESITVEIHNRFGLKSYDTITVNYYNIPSVEITSISSGYDTREHIITISGTSSWTSNPDTIAIYANNTMNAAVVITADSGSWTGTAYVNTLGGSVMVQLNDRFGRNKYDTITVDYFDTPSIGIDFPVSGYDTKESVITLTGTTYWTSNPDTILIYSNNLVNTSVTITSDSGSWSGTVFINNIGESVTVKLSDRFGRTAYDTIYVDYYGSPVIGLTYPADGYDTREHVITVKGTTFWSGNGDTVVIYSNDVVNTTVVLTEDSAAWSGTAYVDNIGESVTVEMHDSFGRINAVTITVDYFDTPVIEISYPADKIDTRQNIITVSGTTLWSSKPDTIVVYTNNNANTTIIISGDSASWNGTAFIDNLGESILVRLNDRFGRSVYDTITVNYYSGPEIHIGYPADMHDTKESVITISGTTLWAAPTDTIVIYSNNTANTIVVLGADTANWSGTVFLDNTGESIIVELNTIFGKSAYDTITVNYYDTPTIEITSPVTDYDTRNHLLTINGTSLWAANPDTIVIYRNNTANTTVVIYEDSTFWSGTVFTGSVGDTIIAKLTDRFGRMVFDTIIVNYCETPSIEINEPLPGYDTKYHIITLTGTSQWSYIADSIIIYSNNTANTTIFVSADSLTWSGTAYIDNLGETVIAGIRDRFGYMVYDTLIVDYFDTPSVGISYPVDKHDTYADIVMINGTVMWASNPDTIIIYTNNNSNTTVVVQQDNGAWSGTSYITGHGDSIFVMLTDRFGRKSYDTITVNQFDTPVIKIVNPYQEQYSIFTNITVDGISTSTYKGDTVYVYIDGDTQDSYVITAENDEWACSAALNKAAETIVASVVDRFGRSFDTTVFIYYYANPEIAITFPVDNYDTKFKYSSIVISGTSANTLTGDTVEIKVNGILNSRTNIYGDSLWTGTAMLTGVGDSLSVIVTNKRTGYNRSGNDTITVNYFDTPSVKITYPGTISHDTYLKTVIIKGTTLNCDNIDTVVIYTNYKSDTQFILGQIEGEFEGTAFISRMSDSIILKITDQFGRTAYDTVTVNYFKLPVIRVTTPDDLHDTLIHEIVLRGTTWWTKPADTLTLYIDTMVNSVIKLSADSETWNGTVYLKDMYETVVTEIKDRFGRLVSDTLIISYFDLPKIEITYPEDGYGTNIVGPLTISGTTYFTKGQSLNPSYPGDTVILISKSADETFSDTYILLKNNGKWSIVIPEIFSMGNTVTVTAYNNKWTERKGSDTIVLNYYGNAPGIEITYPSAASHDTSARIITVRGTTGNSDKGDTILIYTNSTVNDTLNLTAVNGTFEGTALISGTGDSIWVKYIDKFANVSMDTISVTYFDILTDSFAIDEDVSIKLKMTSTIASGGIWTVLTAPDHVDYSISNDSITLVSKKDFSGYDTMVLKFSYGGSFDTKEIIINVRNINDTPVIIRIADPPAYTAVNEKYVYYIKQYDPDTNSLSYAFKVNGVSKGSAAADNTGCTFTWIPETSGTKTIEVSVQDTGSLKDTESFMVYVYKQITNVFNLSAKVIDTGTVLLTWDTPANNGIIQYNIYSDSANQGTIDYTAAVATTTKTEKNISNLNSAREYNFAVKTVLHPDIISENNENVATVNIIPAISSCKVKAAIEEPSNGSVIKAGELSITVKLTGNLTDCAYLDFQYKKTGDTWQVMNKLFEGTAPVTVNDKYDLSVKWDVPDNVSYDVNYYLKVTATDKDGVEDLSPAASVIIFTNDSNKADMVEEIQADGTQYLAKSVYPDGGGGDTVLNKVSTSIIYQEPSGDSRILPVSVEIPGANITGEKWKISMGVFTNEKTGTIFDTDLTNMNLQKANKYDRAIEIKLYDDTGSAIAGVNFKKPLRIGPFIWKDDNNDGLVDGIANQREEDIKIYYKSSETSNISLVSSDSYDLNLDENYLYIYVDHLTIFYPPVFGIASLNVDNVIVYPNPCILDNNKRTGLTPAAGQSPYPVIKDDFIDYTGGIVFVTPWDPPITIKIYTMSGELVRETKDFNYSVYVWDLKNGKGQDVASGWYVYVVSERGKKKTGKIAIVR